MFAANGTPGALERDNGRVRPTFTVMRILLVEDDETVAEPLQRGLAHEGFDVDRVATGAAAFDASEPDVVLLDIGLPDVDGYEVCRRLRARSDVPIVFLSGRCAEEDRVAGLDLGGDDFVVEPFGVRELAARIRAVSRRRVPAPTPGDEAGTGRLVIDRRTHRVVLDGVSVSLTPKEFDVLALLAEDPGAVYERHVLLERVWGHPWFGPTKTLDVHIAGIRKKLGDARWIESVRGVGFRLDQRD